MSDLLRLRVVKKGLYYRVCLWLPKENIWHYYPERYCAFSDALDQLKHIVYSEHTTSEKVIYEYTRCER